MRQPIKPLYYVTGCIGIDDISAHVILDKKNNSIHIHFFGKIFGKTYSPILVRHSNAKFPEDEGIHLAKQIVVDELNDKKVQIKAITAKEGIPTDQTKPKQRTIIRYKK